MQKLQGITAALLLVAGIVSTDAHGANRVELTDAATAVITQA